MNPERHILPLISDYIDGCLPPGLMRQVEEHLAHCPPCTHEVEQWRAVLRLVSLHAAMSCPIDCSEAVLRRIEEAGTPLRPPHAPRETRRAAVGSRIDSVLRSHAARIT